jgi:undecaprenyl-diphosphatase
VDPERRPVYVRAIRAVGVAFAMNTAIKYVVRRPRPDVTGTLSPYSYPSAHAATSFAGARALARAWPASPLYVLATLVALTRTYLGVHYPSDVVGGAALGSAVAELTP